MLYDRTLIDVILHFHLHFTLKNTLLFYWYFNAYFEKNDCLK